MFKQAFKEKLRKIPSLPGVYFFFGKNKKLLYIGKAANLKNRISQYFTEKTYSTFLKYLLDEAEKVDFEVKESETEALISESQLIKKFQPKYNQKMRDDKQYFYVVFTKEKFPKIFLSHQPQKQLFQYRHVDISFLGPFTDGTILKSTLRFLRRIFPYCTCKQKHNNFCLNYHIGKCPGICCLKQQSYKLQIPNSKFQKILRDYKKNIKAIKDILNGKRESLIKKLEKESIKLGKKEDFENAIKLRDQTEKLKRVFENAKIIQRDTNSRMRTNDTNVPDELKKIFKLPGLPKRIEGYDVSNIQGTNATGSMVVFTNGRPDKNEYRKFKIRTKTTPDDIAMLKEILARRFNHPEWQYPDLILIDGGKAQLNAVHSAISNKIPIMALTKNAKHKGDHIFTANKKLPINLNSFSSPVKNLILFIDSEAHRFAISYYRKLHRKTLG